MEQVEEDEEVRKPRGRSRRRVNFQERGGRGLSRRVSHVQRREGERKAPHIRRQISRDEHRKRSSEDTEPAFPTIMEKGEPKPVVVPPPTTSTPPAPAQPHQPKGLPLNLPLPPAPPDFDKQNSVRSVQEALVGAIRLAETSAPKRLPKSLSLSALKTNVANAAAHVTNNNLEVKERRHKVIEQLHNQLFGKVEHLVLNEKETNVLDDCDFIDLLRALSTNTSVKKVTIAADFVSMLNVEEARIFLLIVASLPKLESFHLNFPEDQIVDAEILATMLQRARSCKEIVLNDMQLYAKSNDEMELLGEVLENLFRLENIRFVNLTWPGAEEELAAASVDGDTTVPSSTEEDKKEEGNEEEDENGNTEGSKFSLDPIVLALSTLPNLKVLEITMEHRYNWRGNSLGDLVTECPSLNRIAFSNLSLQVTQVAALGQALVETKTDGDATDEDEDEAGDIVSKKSNLHELVFDDCDLQYQCFLEIGNFIPENRTLLKLNLPNSINLTDDVCMTIATAIENDDYLQELDLSSNKNKTSITPRGLVTMARMLEKNTSLQSLSVTFAGADDSGFVAIAQALQRNASLKKLFLENITPSVPTRGIVALAKALEEKKNTTLQDLTLIFDGEDDLGLLAIATAMGANKTLKTCNLSRT